MIGVPCTGIKTILVQTANTTVVAKRATYSASTLFDAVMYVINN